MKYLLDSVILIDHFNSVEAATTSVAGHGSECVISVIIRAEVLAGFTVRTEPLARELLDVFPHLPTTSEIADLAASLRHSEHWKLPDALQAALAAQHGLTLVTRNSRDFKVGGKVNVVMPYRV